MMVAKYTGKTNTIGATMQLVNPGSLLPGTTLQYCDVQLSYISL
jgi:hypothetical protein